MHKYTHLFKQPSEDASVPEVIKDALNPIPVGTNVQEMKSTVVDEAVTKKVGRDVLLRLKAMEYALTFAGNRPISIDDFGEMFDLLYEKIKNGTRQKELLEWRFRQANLAGKR